MLASTVLTLRAIAEALLPPALGHLVHAAFLSLVEPADPEAARALHDGSGSKPFTVSLLQGPLGRRKEGVMVRQGGLYWLRFTTLERSLFGHLTAYLLGTTAPLGPEGTPILRLGAAGFALDRAAAVPSREGPWAGHTTFEELLRSARAEREITLRFHSPTAFSFGNRGWGRKVELFPQPGLVFGSLLRKWNAFADRPLPRDLVDWVESDVVVARHALFTRMLQFPDAPQVGFMGQCTYEVKGRADEETLRQLNALADFAFYAGVGYKTTMGMGQVRRMEERAAGGSRGCAVRG